MTISETTTLRPGFLVSLKTSLRGNVHYIKTDLDAGGKDGTDTSVARWETVRTIEDAKEHEAGKKARAKAAGLIRSVCKQSAFGLLCPEVDSQKLEQAIEASRKVVDDFNATAKLSRISIYVLTGRVMPDDVEAVRAINSEIRELMAEMERGVEGNNVDAIRDAASRVKGIGEMLSAEAQAKVQIAVETGRAVAKKIVKDGPQQTVDEPALLRIRSMRTSFLDLDEGAEVASPKAGARRSIIEMDATDAE